MKQQQLGRSQKRPGPPVTEATSETPAISTAITATFDVFERMEACEREGTLRHADRSANGANRVRHGFGSGEKKPVNVHFATLTEGLMTAIEFGKVRNLLVEAIKHGMDENSMS